MASSRFPATSRRQRGAIALVALLLQAPPVTAAEVWKWVDAQGVTHYGAAPPDDGRTKAERVELPDTAVPEADRRAAEKRLADDKAEIRRAAGPASAPRPEVPLAAARPAVAASAVPSCEEAWRRYNESYACFDPYRYGAGKIRPEAYVHCKEMPQPPALCR
jgi:hypothetical protein